MNRRGFLKGMLGAAAAAAAPVKLARYGSFRITAIDRSAGEITIGEESILDQLVRAAALIRREGGRPDMVIVSPKVAEQLGIEVEARGNPTEVDGLVIVADPWCPGVSSYFTENRRGEWPTRVTRTESDVWYSAREGPTWRQELGEVTA